MNIFSRLLQAILRGIDALRENTQAVKEGTAASVALAIEVKALREQIVQPEPLADRAVDPVLSVSVVNEP